MNTPKPTPPKSALGKKATTPKQKNGPAKPNKAKQSNKKLTVFVATLPSGKTVDIRAEELLEVGPIVKKKYKEFPVDVKKKPFERPEHLTDRPLAQNSDLKALKRQLTNTGSAK